jgi:transposase
MSEYHRLAFWTNALNLPGFRVVHERRDTPSDPARFTLVPVENVAVCPQCGHACDTIHRRHESAPIKDLPLGEQNVELIVHTPQYECDRCQNYFTPTYPAIAGGAHATQRFLAHVARLIGFSDIANVAALYQLSESTLTRWYYDYIERQQLQPAPIAGKPIKCLGIDELSQKKGTASSSV